MEREGISRREILKSALAAAGVHALPSSVRATEGVQMFLDDLRVLSAEMRSARIRGDLAGGSPAVIQRILAENTIRLPPIAALRDSHLNPEHLFKYPLLIGSRVDENDRRRHLSLFGAGDAQRQVYDLAEAVNGRLSHGNAVAIATQTIITAGHLDAALKHVPDVTLLSARGTDIAVALVAGGVFSPEQMVTLPTRIRDSDVHGQFVVIPGVDPDPTAMHRGVYKVYDGLAFQVTPAMAQVLLSVNQNDPESVRMWHWAHHSLCLVIPEGESAPHTVGDAHPRAAGMSGSPVFTLRDNRYVFVGVLWGVSSFSYSNKRYSLGFFIGPETLSNVSSMLSSRRGN